MMLVLRQKKHHGRYHAVSPKRCAFLLWKTRWISYSCDISYCMKYTDSTLQRRCSPWPRDCTPVDPPQGCLASTSCMAGWSPLRWGNPMWNLPYLPCLGMLPCSFLYGSWLMFFSDATSLHMSSEFPAPPLENHLLFEIMNGQFWMPCVDIILFRAGL